MKRHLPKLLGGLAVAALAAAILYTLTAEDEQVWLGYAEGEFVWAALPEGGILEARPAMRGLHAPEGALLFALDAEDERAALEEARSALDRARAERDNLLKGLRDSEIDALLAQKRQAEATLEIARLTLERRQALLPKEFASQEAVDQARAEFEQAQGRVRELEARLVTARLPAREDQIAAANARIEEARAALARAQWRLSRREAVAPAAGEVTDTFFDPGEFVPQGRPVVSLLPPANIKVRFFVSQAEVGGLAPGDPVTVTCDGCAAPIPAAISFIAPEAEFTPPVIYSEEARQKLVFLVEARPGREDAMRLKPGQPVEVRPRGDQ